MRVLIVSHMWPNVANRAAGCFVAEQVKEIRNRCDVAVVAPLPAVPRIMRRFKPHWGGFWNTPFHETMAGVEVYRPRFFCLPKNASLLLDGFFYRAGIHKTFEQICRHFRFDILHVHCAVPDGVGVLLVNRKYNLPVVLSIHGRDIYSIAPKSPFHRRLVGNVLARADRVIVASDKVRELMARSFPRVAEPAIIHYGVDAALFAPGDAAPIGARSSRTGPVLLTVGYLIARKNHRAVISAVARLKKDYPEIRLRIAGSGPEEEKLRSLCAELGVSENVEFLGLCSRERVKQLMSECDVFVMPSWDEAFGVVYIEAMSQGKPVIGSRGEGIADTITDGETGFLVDPHNVDELAEKIRLLIDDGELAARVGAAGRDLVVQEFTWQKNVDRLLEVYQEVLTQHQRRSERA